MLCKKLFLISILFSVSIVFAQSNWKKVKEANGITVYSDDNMQGTIKKYQAIGTIDASVWTILALMDDLDSYPEWNGNCIHAEIIVPKKDGVMVQYFVNSAPWPVKGRDVLLKTKEFIDLSAIKEDGNENALIEISIQSVADNKLVPEKEGYVRMKELTGYWKFRGLPDNKTEITYSIETDLAGNIPAAISNMVSKDIPYNTLIAIRKMVLLQKYIDGGKRFYNIAH